ncbi:MAG TPA: nitrate reductase molybdenum cofactor assembly chaperone [Gammaproteobacteria bacterium]|nr:nitrate reductase molybdenum cofactor assembly chaperone [Gammaproteobacteria bacterium]
MTHLSTINPNLRSLAVIARVLDYPCTDLQEAADAMVCVIRDEGRIPAEQRQSLMDFIRRLRDTELLDIQADYVETFDRGRAVSLLLFEHVHGESRARGQAMVDLKALYARHGLELAPGELPDFLPLFLEFLSILPLQEATAHLSEHAHIVAALH